MQKQLLFLGKPAHSGLVEFLQCLCTVKHVTAKQCQNLFFLLAQAVYFTVDSADYIDAALEVFRMNHLL